MSGERGVAILTDEDDKSSRAFEWRHALLLMRVIAEAESGGSEEGGGLHAHEQTGAHTTLQLAHDEPGVVVHACR